MNITFPIGRQESELALRVNNAAYHGDLYQLKSLIRSGAKGVRWAVPPGLACGPAHYIVVSCRAGPVTVVGRAGTTWVSGPCRA